MGMNKMAKKSEIQYWRRRIERNYVAGDGDSLFLFIEKINNQLLAHKTKVEQLEKRNKELVRKLKDAKIEAARDYTELELEDRRNDP
jgi:ribosome biogenesis protein Nip4